MWLFYPSLRKVYLVSTNHAASISLKNLLPVDTWALIDSNEQLTSVPPCITSMGTFIVQTTSPGVCRTEWAKRNYTHVRWYMASWTLPELICGRDFEPLDEDAHPTSEKDLEAFMAVCPPSARLADLLRDKHFDFEEHVSSYQLRIRTSAMTLQNIGRLLSNDLEFDKDDTILHHFFVVTPSPMRHIAATYIPSREISRLLRDILRVSKA
ncbi:hypothetical protein K438DRAFT_781654 [Mycena galopus ATCC 62051]|nr:hypothetical protein K438DRAFT_781654 [Mycena galopus ATCC 62051]